MKTVVALYMNRVAAFGEKPADVVDLATAGACNTFALVEGADRDAHQSIRWDLDARMRASKMTGRKWAASIQAEYGVSVQWLSAAQIEEQAQ